MLLYLLYIISCAQLAVHNKVQSKHFGECNFKNEQSHTFLKCDFFHENNLRAFDII